MVGFWLRSELVLLVSLQAEAAAFASGQAQVAPAQAVVSGSVTGQCELELLPSPALTVRVSQRPGHAQLGVAQAAAPAHLDSAARTL